MCHSLDEVKRLVTRFDDSVAFVINHSGGKDSTRMLGFVRQCFPSVLHLASWPTPDSNTDVRLRLKTSHVLGAQTSTFGLLLSAIHAALTSRWSSSVACLPRHSIGNASRI